jgi:hypothetical protein
LNSSEQKTLFSFHSCTMRRSTFNCIILILDDLVLDLINRLSILDVTYLWAPSHNLDWKVSLLIDNFKLTHGKHNHQSIAWRLSEDSPSYWSAEDCQTVHDFQRRWGIHPVSCLRSHYLR